jgi:hypothetical protein
MDAPRADQGREEFKFYHGLQGGPYSPDHKGQTTAKRHCYGEISPPSVMDMGGDGDGKEQKGDTEKDKGKS